MRLLTFAWILSLNNSQVFGLDKTQFQKSISLAVKVCIFLLNVCLFTQRDGVAMGNPLGPCLANAFLSYHEVSWMENCPLRI